MQIYVNYTWRSVLASSSFVYLSINLWGGQVPPIFFCYQLRRLHTFKCDLQHGCGLTDHPSSAQLTAKLIWSVSHRLSSRVFPDQNWPFSIPQVTVLIISQWCILKISGLTMPLVSWQIKCRLVRFLSPGHSVRCLRVSCLSSKYFPHRRGCASCPSLFYPMGICQTTWSTLTRMS